MRFIVSPLQKAKYSTISLNFSSFCENLAKFNGKTLQICLFFAFYLSLTKKVHNYTKFAFKGNVAKVGVASALIGAGLFLSACGGGDEFKPSSEAEKQVVNLIKNKSADAKILSFSVAQKEFGL